MNHQESWNPISNCLIILLHNYELLSVLLTAYLLPICLLGL